MRKADWNDKKRRGRPRVDWAVMQAVEDLANKRPHKTATEIFRQLQEDEQFADLRAKLPIDVRTIQRLVKEVRVVDDSGPWAIQSAERGEIAIVLPVIEAVIDVTFGEQRTITKAEAAWVLKVDAADPDLAPFTKYLIASQYQRRSELGRVIDHLDFFLAMKPWRKRVRFDAFVDKLAPDAFGTETSTQVIFEHLLRLVRLGESA